jgi:hypothetical protein
MLGNLIHVAENSETGQENFVPKTFDADKNNILSPPEISSTGEV